MRDINQQTDEIISKIVLAKRQKPVDHAMLRHHIGLVLNSFALLRMISPQAAEHAWDAIGRDLEE